MKKILAYTAFILAVTSSAAMAHDELKSSANYSKASYDIQFLDTMIAHHNQGLELAQITASKSQNKEIKNKAQARADSLQAEIAEMQSARDDIQENAPPAINVDLDGMEEVDVKSFNVNSG
jgi:uncharacterized protein (DUF305 family)